MIGGQWRVVPREAMRETSIGNGRFARRLMGGAGDGTIVVLLPAGLIFMAALVLGVWRYLQMIPSRRESWCSSSRRS